MQWNCPHPAENMELHFCLSGEKVYLPFVDSRRQTFSSRFTRIVLPSPFRTTHTDKLLHTTLRKNFVHTRLRSIPLPAVYVRWRFQTGQTGQTDQTDNITKRTSGDGRPTFERRLIFNQGWWRATCVNMVDRMFWNRPTGWYEINWQFVWTRLTVWTEVDRKVGVKPIDIFLNVIDRLEWTWLTGWTGCNWQVELNKIGSLDWTRCQ